ncbi:hypothetical protein [Sphingopyxis sp.]|uniref:hypothetical protein n=1 Tax=Sphingopyxis sp. TaxID=1908224 RepID=UPI003D1441AC
MLTPQDDLIGHQTTTTFDHVQSSDPAWMERLWYTGHPIPGGDVIFDIGLGYHPNRNVMDAFAGITRGGEQIDFRVSRQARPNPLETTLGPLAIEVVEGLRHHHISLAENASGLTFDLDFLASMNAHEEEAHFRRRKGRVTEDMARVQQLGRYRGWIALDGERWDVTPESWWGQRDHSWGIRAEMRTDPDHLPMTFYPPFLFLWITVQFEGYGLQLFLKERAPGDTIYITGEEVRPVGERSGGTRRLVAMTHDIDWANDGMGQTVASATLEPIFSDGSRRKLEVRALPARYFLKGGLYGGLDGWFHGDDKGKLFADHSRWKLDKAADRTALRTLSDHVIEVRDGDNIGWGIMEYGVGEGYARYPEVQAFPPI